jgi:type IV pilus assembly protein PilY1
MFSFARRFRHVATGALLAGFVSFPVVAEDSEIYVSAGTSKEAQPNVLFVIDTSRSMRTEVGTTGASRIEVVRDVAIGLATRLRNVNLGLMRYNPVPEGGYVLQPVSDIENPTHRQALLDELQALNDAAVDGSTPLSETYYEAALYFTGGKVDYGAASIRSAKADNDETTYKSPISHQCQKNYIVYLTDGIPNDDWSANQPERIPAMTGASCDAATTENNEGMCADELAGYLASTDGDLSATVEGNQNVLTYFIGFGNEVADQPQFRPDDIAAAGGTERAYTATNAQTLTDTLGDIFDDLLVDRGTFVTPAVSVDAFNRAQADDELFFSLFRATGRQHWAGNLKKYALLDGQIVDANDQPAVTGGFFTETAQSIWSAAADGDDIEAGGAVALLGTPDSRNIYTAIASSNLKERANWLTVIADDNTGPNGPFSDLIVGTGTDPGTCTTACREAILWARGDDVNTATPTNDFIRKMGDPLHGQPAVVTYGNYNPANQAPDTYVFMPTNDGMLHAFDGRTAGNTTKELWAFMPNELLGRLGALREDAFAADRSFGLDGDVRVLKLDKNQNGIIEADADPDVSDRVWLFFGMRSGGNHYYALDVTTPDSPKLLWNIGPDELPGVGLTWSPPVVTRVNVKDANDDDEKFVLIFGGGYDYAQETQTYSKDATGNRVFMVDASTGKRLWFAGGYDTGTPPAVLPNLELTTDGRAMDNAIPGRIAVIDHSGDGFADRMYAGDMGGRVWRFDILNGKAPDDLVRGGVFADLGTTGVTTPTAADNRRFYNAPDVALISRRGSAPYYNVAIGSGYRGHPLNRATVERFYSLRDTDPFVVYTQDTYDTRTNIIRDDDATGLPDVSSNPAASTVDLSDRGWKYTFSSGRGEKVLAEATTVNGTILFPTYEPVDPTEENPCVPTSINRVYALTAFGGKPAINFLNDAGNEALNNLDVSTTLNQQGIVGAVNVALLTEGDDDGDDDDENGGTKTLCMIGVEVLKRCVDAGSSVRTYWQRNDVP